MMKILPTLAILIAVACGAWVWYSPGYDSAVAFLSAIFTYGITFMSQKNERGSKGGSAINSGEDSDISIENHGSITSGKGGPGGPGGDAIQTAPGVKIRIINHGVISGGDAGQAE